MKYFILFLIILQILIGVRCYKALKNTVEKVSKNYQSYILQGFIK